MERNQATSRNGSKVGLRKPDRYSRRNPPPNEEVATERLEVLAEDESLIQTKLDNADPLTFQSDGAYADWRRRTTTALGFVKLEWSFLTDWLAEQKPVHGERDYIRLRRISDNIREKAKEVSEKIAASYVVRYSNESLPEDLDQAHSRVQELSAIKREIQIAFTQITELWTAHALKRELLTGLKRPLNILLARLENEMALVKGYIRRTNVAAHGKTPSKPTSWKVTLFLALDRAVSEGFVLTPEEEAVLEAYRRV